jgi:hypothetical protein
VRPASRILKSKRHTDYWRRCMSRQLKLILFVLVFNVIGFAEGYLLHDLGLQWVLPIIFATALGAVLLSRRWL